MHAAAFEPRPANKVGSEGTSSELHIGRHWFEPDGRRRPMPHPATRSCAHLGASAGPSGDDGAAITAASALKPECTASSSGAGACPRAFDRQVAAFQLRVIRPCRPVSPIGFGPMAPRRATRSDNGAPSMLSASSQEERSGACPGREPAAAAAMLKTVCARETGAGAQAGGEHRRGVLRETGQARCLPRGLTRRRAGRHRAARGLASDCPSDGLPPAADRRERPREHRSQSAGTPLRSA